MSTRYMYEMFVWDLPATGYVGELRVVLVVVARSYRRIAVGPVRSGLSSFSFSDTLKLKLTTRRDDETTRQQEDHETKPKHGENEAAAPAECAY
mmetsp:Transcript_26850/g.59659  ORF Transcript_26850/g.59659 Transcript_26850/m.59659 type:complete len:94 (-) Transcript_26850:50-331(-)